MDLGELLYDVCGGPRDGRQFKAVIPGGSSSKVSARCGIQSAESGRHHGKNHLFDIPPDLDSIAQHGSMSDLARSSSWTTPAPCPGP
ncbi:MAG: hypothetical protein ACLT38_11575 [Akkermansia sp.]